MRQAKLSDIEQKALQAFITYLTAFMPGDIKWVALFGSKARGESGPDSDIDILVIVSKEDRRLRREILREAARISLEYDVLLSPRVIGSERWEKMRGFSLYQNVQREATRMSLVDGGELVFETP